MEKKKKKNLKAAALKSRMIYLRRRNEFLEKSLTVLQQEIKELTTENTKLTEEVVRLSEESVEAVFSILESNEINSPVALLTFLRDVNDLTTSGTLIRGYDGESEKA